MSRACVRGPVALDQDATRVIKAADWYRRRNYNPLPSCVDHGYPCFYHTKARDEGLSKRSFDRFVARGYHRGTSDAHNVQLATGAKWNLAVVDLDGPRSRVIWDWWVQVNGDHEPTWVVATPSGGRHLWFSVPPGMTKVPYRILWRAGDGAKHELIELLGDGRLAKAPPSYRLVDGEVVRYTWERGHSPADIPAPTVLPEWVVSSSGEPNRGPKVSPTDPPLTRIRFKGPGVPQDERFDHRSVFRSIQDKIALAAEYGLRVVSDSENASGWVRCHAIDREDRNPSASFHPTKGVYSEPGRGVYLRFFELLAILGGHGSWMEACDAVGSRLGIPLSHK